MTIARDDTFKRYQTRGRFCVEPYGDNDGWQLVDNLDGYTIWQRSRRAAQEAATFAREYVKAHGDIDLGAFPYDVDTPLRYDRYPGDEDRRPWPMVDEPARA